MIVLVALCLLLTAALVAVVWLSGRQLRAMERLLLARGHGRSGKVRLTFPTPAAQALALQVNALIDEADGARRAADAERQELQRNLASFSHDVRTPLTGAQGYLQLYKLAESDAERNECVAAATERLGVMRGLVDQLFEFAKIDEGAQELPREEVDLGAVVAEALGARYPSFVERGWEPAVRLPECAVMVRANGEALGRLVGNLLDNCLRHGSGAPCVELRIGAEREEAPGSKGSRALEAKAPTGKEPLARDSRAPEPVSPDAPAAGTIDSGRTHSGNGAGFELVVSNPADRLDSLDIARVFDRFYRGDGARQAGGSGLGLAIAFELAQAMGLQLTAEAEAERFVMRLEG
ncbi:HAMP domain-containing sensor histidine kinase [Adlercreutzia equolifaciens]|uniref:sensor histidine kinase n=1 Tax=Adlercreutzia equolifaciens TaxID=446660 RepID=UPI0023AF7AAC|nr:HAMP domain-containing sensor histidine kinase [Adlercreutzia equolifaciens]MDE8702759.1 HAMP domain-containing sensor histidine kinase [Adlercreutzia equolifaciens]